MNEEIPISVVMSVYNGERYLSLAIESVLKQTFKDFEFIIVDDGSTDRSLEIIRKYEKKDSRIRVLVQENQGLAAALNNGIAMARGKYIARMDDDDISLPNRLQLQYEFMESHPEIVASSCNVIVINKWGDEYDLWKREVDSSVIDSNHVNLGYTSLCHPSAIIKKSAFDAVGGYSSDIRYAQDLDLWLKMGEYGALTNLPEALILYRFHNNAASGAHRQEQYKCVLLAVTRARQRRGITEDSFSQIYSGELVPNEKTILYKTAQYQFKKKRYFKAAIYYFSWFIKEFPSLFSDWLAKRLIPHSPWLQRTLEIVDSQHKQIQDLQEQLKN
ncbi:MAG: glycosyltransferase [Thermoguttaceae bacterium]|nr:glycosyltransferase [Thermoguttaceae bacterium]